MATPASNTIPLSGDARIDGLVQGSSWQFGGGAAVLTYSLNINDSVDGLNNPIGGTWAQHPTIAEALGRAFAEWAKVANISFVSLGVGGVYNTSIADLAVTLAGNDLSGSFGAASLGFFPDPVFGNLLREAATAEGFSYPLPEGDLFFDNYLTAYSNVAAGALGFTYLLHEIGHALGLKHPHDDGANSRPTFAAQGIAHLDTSANTLMGNSAILGSGNLASGNVATLMPLDILAIQRIYGANTTYNAGDNVYALADDGVVRTLWDGGGADTVSAAGVDLFGGVMIDLRPGALSTHGTLSKTAIAFNVVIENAIGSVGSDTMHGNDADNRLDGGTGENAQTAIDTMVGHGGNDLYIVDSDADVVTEVANEGLDSVISSVTHSLAVNVENLILTGVAAIDGSGNALSNALSGNSANNVLMGLEGNDALDGGGGTNTLDGGEGNDYYITSGTDTIIDSGGTDAVGTYTFFSLVEGGVVENLVLLGPASYGAGNSGANVIIGNALNNPLLRGDGGADTIYGGAGDDWIEGEAGVNPFSGVAGNDVLLGEAGNDVALGGPGNDLIAGGAGIDTLLGDAGDDIIAGEADLDYISGGEGDDTLHGQLGNDVLYGDLGNDIVYGGDGDDIMMGEAGDTTVSVGGIDVLYGEAGNDSIHGGANGDGIDGGTGIDLIDGGHGNDAIAGGLGADLMIGSGITEFTSGQFPAGTSGDDVFIFYNIYEAGDQIYGFDTRAGNADKLYLVLMFDSLGYAGMNPRADGYLQVVQNGADTQVQIDADGAAGGPAFSTLVSLMSVTANTIDDSFFYFQ